MHSILKKTIDHKNPKPTQCSNYQNFIPLSLSRCTGALGRRLQKLFVKRKLKTKTKTTRSTVISPIKTGN